MLGPEFSEYVVIMLFTIHDPSVSAGGWCAKESKVISIGPEVVAESPPLQAIPSVP